MKQEKSNMTLGYMVTKKFDIIVTRKKTEERLTWHQNILLAGHCTKNILMIMLQ